MTTAAETFESWRPSLLALAYRMLGDLGRAEDLVQEAWIRFSDHETTVREPHAYLLKVVTHLCLNELSSARARKEEQRSDRLPEPISLERTGLEQAEALERVSMAFLVLLQRLTPAERAVLLLHEVFGFGHAEVARLLGRSGAACRKLLERARSHVADERHALAVTPEQHQRLLHAFVAAVTSGDLDALTALLAADAELIVDGGRSGARFAGVRNLPGPLRGGRKIAAFLRGVAARGAASLATRDCLLNGEPALLVLREGVPIAAILLATSGTQIRRIFMQADPDRLRRV